MRPDSADEIQKALRVLGFEDRATLTAEEVKAKARDFVSRFHPDRGGSTHLAQEINVARDILLRWITAGCPSPGNSDAQSSADQRTKSETERRQNEEYERRQREKERNARGPDTEKTANESTREQPEQPRAQTRPDRESKRGSILSLSRYVSAKPGLPARVLFFLFYFSPVIYYYRSGLGDFTGNQDQGRRIESATKAVAFSGDMFFPLEARDIPAPCTNQPTNVSCKAVFDEFRESYGSVRCGYYDRSIDKTWYYFFWFRKVPANMAAMARNDPKAAIRAMGSTAINECPRTQDAAEALYKQNDR